METQARPLQTRRSAALFAAFVAFMLGMLIMLCSATPALATHKATIDTGPAGGKATMLSITGATDKVEGFQFGTYEDPLGNLKIDVKEVNAYASRDLYVRNDTKYKIKLTLYGVAQTNYTSFSWLWFGDATAGYGMVKSEGTKDVVVMNTILAPGKQFHIYAVDTNLKKPSTARIALKASYQYYGEVEKLQTKKPEVSATKLASNKVEVCVKLPDGKSAVNGVSKLDLYQGSKKVKSWKYSAQTPVRRFSATGSNVAKAKFKVVSTTIGDSSDKITSDVVTAKANTTTVGKKPKLTAVDEYGTGFFPTKLSYKGSKLVVEGYTVSRMPAVIPSILYIQISVPGKQIAYYNNYNYKYAKGIKKVKFTLKASKVVNLRAGDVSVHNN